MELRSATAPLCYEGYAHPQMECRGNQNRTCRPSPSALLIFLIIVQIPGKKLSKRSLVTRGCLLAAAKSGPNIPARKENFKCECDRKSSEELKTADKDLNCCGNFQEGFYDERAVGSLNEVAGSDIVPSSTLHAIDRMETCKKKNG